jgi:hypothetical protein
MPEVNIDSKRPANIPPVVSMEKDLPGLSKQAVLAEDRSLINVYPEIMQNGASRIIVKIMLLNSRGVSPVSRNNLVRRNIISNETRGAIEKIRLILGILFISDLPAIYDPAADAMSQEARKIPAISS